MGAFVRLAPVSIEPLAGEVDAVVAYVETWLEYAEAIGLTAEPQVARGAQRSFGMRPAKGRVLCGCGAALSV